MRIVILIIVLLIAGCAKPTPKPSFSENDSHLFKVENGFVYTYDANGEVVDSVKVNNGFRRIVVLSSPMFTYFKALNTTDKVVGILNKKRLQRVPKFIQSAGENGLPNKERILALRPDLIICNTNQLQQITSIDCEKLVIDEYLEADPVKRISFLKVVGAITNATKKAHLEFSKRITKFQNYPKIEKKLIKLDYFSGTWYQPGCATYFTQTALKAGADVICYEESSKSEVITNELALKLVAEGDMFVFHDWHENETGWGKRLLPLKSVLTKKINVLYCNSYNSNYFEASLINSAEIIRDMHQVLSTGIPGKFYKIIQLEP